MPLSLSSPATPGHSPSPASSSGLPCSLPSPRLQPWRGLGDASAHTPTLPALATSLTSFQSSEVGSPISSPATGMGWGQSRGGTVASFVGATSESGTESSPSFGKEETPTPSFSARPAGPRRRGLRPDSPALSLLRPELARNFWNQTCGTKYAGQMCGRGASGYSWRKRRCLR